MSIPLSADLEFLIRNRTDLNLTPTDLDYIGSCLPESYCSPESHTCLLRRSPGAACASDFMCEYLSYPGICRNGTCLAEGRAWGDGWQTADANLIAAVVIAAVVTGLMVWVRMRVAAAVEKWGGMRMGGGWNPEADMGGLTPGEGRRGRRGGEDGGWWERARGAVAEVHTWWVERRERVRVDYVQLAARGAIIEEPPAYQE